ncbi:MAG: M23 family metallopeptidase [Bacteroidales bacterium]|jgi:murein DD-endopeptidase MepM/ murein hydrolase activator NlpD
MRNRKYFLDLNDLQYKQVRISLEKKLLRVALWLTGTIAIALFYISLFHSLFGSPKEALLNQQIGNLKLQYALVQREMDHSLKLINNLRMSDELSYRPVLEMDSIPFSYRNPGFGGIDRFSELNGYVNGGLMKSTKTKIEELKNMVSVQGESFRTIGERASEWRYEMDHMPAISPVDVTYRLGDGFKFREIHPVLGTPRWHYGQDFCVPYGTNVYATGDGKVIEAGYNGGGFGNYVVIDHGYGLQTIYGHLSQIKVSQGMNVKRGALIGLSGSTGSSTGPHLHYQIDKYGQHVNPVNYFNNDMSEEEFTEMIKAFESKSRFR